jgi:uncharacterized integral membrane protein
MAVFVLGVIVGVAVLAAVLPFVLATTETVTLRYTLPYLFAWETRPIPLPVVILAAVGVGVIIAGMLRLAAYLRQRTIIRQHLRRIAELETELHALRTLPLDAPLDAPSRPTTRVVTDAGTPERSGELLPR